VVAAMMTAANLGSRVTGWGFVVFTVGSCAWAAVGLLSGQSSLAVTNAFLLVVNIFGVWRWLGKQAAYEDGSARAAKRSHYASVPTLFSGGSMIGTPVKGRDGSTYGTVVDSMLCCGTKSLAYVVTTEGGVGGVGETLRAVLPNHLNFTSDEITCNLTTDEWQALPAIVDGKWPPVAPDLEDILPH
jgi:hypothetical protein